MAENELKSTPLTKLHEQVGAKMGEFTGYSMPLFYNLGLMKEHLHCRDEAGLFDISHMVHIQLVGVRSAALISHLCPYEAAGQKIGTCRYTFLLNEHAGIIDDLIVTRLDIDRFLIVANAGCAEKDIAHVKAHASGFGVTVEVLSRGFLALQGPSAEAALTAAGIDASSLSFMTAMETSSGWFISRTGYTGEDGFEIGLPIDETEKFAKDLLSDRRVELIGLGARDSLRLEAGLSLYGQDLDEEITPHEAGLIWAIPKDLREAGKFIGAIELAKKITDGRKRMRVGLQPVKKMPVREGTVLTNGDDEEIGTITSGGFGPSIDYPVALGLISVEAKDGPIFADVRGRKIEMNKTKLPFAPHRYKR